MLAPESSSVAKSHRRGRIQFRHRQLPVAQPSRWSPVLTEGLEEVVDADVVDEVLEAMAESWTTSRPPDDQKVGGCDDDPCS